jgi:putative membrane protein
MIDKTETAILYFQIGLFSAINQYLAKCSPKISEYRRIARVRNRRVHMANERTFLSWIRTSVGIMAFGFVVEKFGLFIKQISFFISRDPGRTIPIGQTPSPGYSSVFGIVLIGLGALMGVLAFVRYRKVECQIDSDTYQPSLILDILLTLSFFAIGMFLIIYLVHSI